MKKSTTFYGENAQISNRFSGTGGGSADFAKAQANVAGNKYGKFLIDHAKDYSIVRIETLAVRKTQNNAGALVKAVKEEADGGFYTIRRSMSRTVWGNGGGARGQVGALNGDTITLSDPNDIVGFEVGMSVSAAADDGTGGAGELDGNAQVITALDEDAGTITAAGAWDAGDFAVDQFLFREGDYDAMPKGFDAWVPEDAPSSGESFFGFDRSVHATRHAGIRFVATAEHGNIERALVAASARGMRSNAFPTSCYLNPIDYGQLVNELGAKARYDQTMGQGYNGKKAQFGFEGLCLYGVATASGKIMIYPDADAPKSVAAMVNDDQWEFMGLGPLPGFLDEDGSGQWLRLGDADAMEARIGYYGNIVCHAPGHQIRVDLSEVV